MGILIICLSIIAIETAVSIGIVAHLQSKHRKEAKDYEYWLGLERSKRCQAEDQLVAVLDKYMPANKPIQLICITI